MLRRITRMTAAAVGLSAALLLPSTAYSAYALSQSQLKAKTLSLSDMPSGWSVAHIPSNSLTALTGCLSEVKAFNQQQKGVPRVRVDYIDGSAPPLLQDTLISDKGVAKQYDQAIALMNTCKAVSYEASGTKVTGSIGAMSFPTVGDVTKAFAVRLSTKGLNAGTNLCSSGSVKSMVTSPIWQRASQIALRCKALSLRR